MSDWKVAMLCLLPLMVGGAWRVKLRVWAALCAGSVAAHIMPSVHAFIVIDLITAGIVMLPPKGGPQRFIGASLLLMAMLSMGLLGATAFLHPLQESSASIRNQIMLFESLMFISWVQFGALLLWGLSDVLGGRLSLPLISMGKTPNTKRRSEG